MPVKAVLFDFFDTLVLIEGGENFYIPSLRSLHNFLVKKGINTSFEEFKQAYFEVRDRLYSETAENLEEPHFNIRVSETLKKLGYNFSASDKIVVDATEAFSNEFMRYVRLDAEAPEALQKLHEKYKLGIVSNFAIPECLRKLLEKFDLEKFFDAIVISGEINKRKPSPEIFQKALEALQVKASETIFVGDTLNIDVKGAKNIGIKAILIKRKRENFTPDTPKTFIQKQLEDDTPPKPEKVIKNLKELPSMLENHVTTDNNTY
ncbi:MAG: HAD family hydrolase [Candidatus Bathyarchaeales archaeon]